jgi:hypothetical protein
MMPPRLETARTGLDIARLDGKRAVAVGQYLAIERPIRGVAKKPGPKDRALLELEDGTKVYLEPLDSSESQRPAGELQRFDRKRVRVQGVFHARMPSKGQSLTAPCITDVGEVAEE